MKFYVIKPTTRIVVGYYGGDRERKKFALPGDILTVTQGAVDELDEGTFEVLSKPVVSGDPKKEVKEAIVDDEILVKEDSKKAKKKASKKTSKKKISKKKVSKKKVTKKA